MSYISQIASQIGAMLETESMTAHNLAVNFRNQGIARKNTLVSTQNAKISEVAAQRSTKKTSYQSGVDSDKAAFDAKVVLVKTISDSADGYKSLPELEAELAAEEAALVAQAASITATVNAALKARVDAWGVASDSKTVFDAFDADAILAV